MFEGSVIEFQNSEVSCVDDVNGSLQVSFSAAHIHWPSSLSGDAVGNGFVQSVVLHLQQAAWSGILSECVGNLSDGKLIVDECTMKLVPLPFKRTGSITLLLHFSNGEILSATGIALQVIQTEPPQFVENFAC